MTITDMFGPYQPPSPCMMRKVLVQKGALHCVIRDGLMTGFVTDYNVNFDISP